MIEIVTGVDDIDLNKLIWFKRANVSNWFCSDSSGFTIRSMATYNRDYRICVYSISARSVMVVPQQ